jgi:hypothetical protein
MDEIGVIYASTSQPAPHGTKALEIAVNSLLHTVKEANVPQALWFMQYQQNVPVAKQSEQEVSSGELGTILRFPSPSLDISFDDTAFESVASIWSKVIGPAANNSEFLKFPDREGEADEDGDED